MSYILDALKKAEAQRTLGALPNIHAPVFAAAPNERAPFWRRAWRWGAATLMLLAALAWLRPWQPGATPPPVPAPALAPAPPVAAALPAPLNVVRPVVPPVAPLKVVPPVAPPKVVPPASKPAAGNLSLSRSLSQPAAAAPPPARKKPAPPPEAPEPELQTLRELPPQIQAEIPPLVVSGYLYSSKQAERSLLINNQLLHEGDTVAPGLILEKILRGAVVLNYQGYRYRMPY